MGQVASARIDHGLGGHIDHAVPLFVQTGTGNPGDPQHGFVLTMALGAAIALAADLLEDLNLLGLARFDQGRIDAGTLDGRQTQGHGRAITQHEDLAKRHIGTGLTIQLFDHQHVTRRNPVLLAAGLNYRVHRSRPKPLDSKRECAREKAREREARSYTDDPGQVNAKRAGFTPPMA